MSLTLSFSSNAEKTPSSILGMSCYQMPIPLVQAGGCTTAPKVCIAFNLTLHLPFSLCFLSPSSDHWSFSQQSTSWNRVNHVATLLNFHQTLTRGCTIATLTIISSICSKAESGDHGLEVLFFDALWLYGTSSTGNSNTSRVPVSCHCPRGTRTP